MKIYNYITKNKKNTCVFLIILGLICSIPVFLKIGINNGHDLYFHLSRISALTDSFKLGNFNPSIYPNYLNGYGYANPLFYPDLFLYIPAFLSYLGLNVILSYKIFLILLNIFSCFTMYITIKKISKNKFAAIMGSILYGLSSYRLVDMFTRAALGETIALAFIPLVILGIYYIIYDDYKKFYVLVIGMTGIILSHVVTTYIISIILVILCLINIKKFLKDKKRILYLVISAFITLLLTAYFLVPMLEQMITNEFVLNNLDINYNLYSRTVPIIFLFIEFPYFFEIWIPAGIGIVFLYILYLKITNRKIKDKFMNTCLIIGIISLIATSKIFPWSLFQKILSPIQFPWRFYLVATSFLIIGGSILLSKLDNKMKYFKIISILSLIPLISVGITAITKKDVKDIGEYTISMAEYLPLKVDINYINNRSDIVATNNINTNIKKNGTTLEIEYNSNEKENNLELPLIYYKGYVAYVDSIKTDVYQTDNGLVGINLKNKEGKIKVYYEGTKLSKIASIISLSTLILFIIYLKFRRGEV